MDRQTSMQTQNTHINAQVDAQFDVQREAHIIQVIKREDWVEDFSSFV
jgi:predicted component of type VI protein secretion system